MPHDEKASTFDLEQNSTYIDGLHMIGRFNQGILYNKPSYCGTKGVGSEQTAHVEIPFPFHSRQKKVDTQVIYSDTDSLAYDIRHPDIYQWISQNREHFDLTDCVRADLKT